MTSPEETEILKRTKELETQVDRLESEARSLEGKIKNRSAADPKPVETEIQSLETRIKRIRSLLGACFVETLKGATEPEAFQQAETLRLSAVEYFKRTNVDAELWKNIVS